MKRGICSVCDRRAKLTDGKCEECFEAFGTSCRRKKVRKPREIQPKAFIKFKESRVEEYMRQMEQYGRIVRYDTDGKERAG